MIYIYINALQLRFVKTVRSTVVKVLFLKLGLASLADCLVLHFTLAIGKLVECLGLVAPSASHCRRLRLGALLASNNFALFLRIVRIRVVSKAVELRLRESGCRLFLCRGSGREKEAVA